MRYNTLKEVGNIPLKKLNKLMVIRWGKKTMDLIW